MRSTTKSFICLIAIGLAAGGCASPNAHNTMAVRTSAEQFVALAVLGPDRPSDVPAGGFRLGAGDSLGEAVYENYLTVVRSNPQWQYAIGE